MLETWGVAGVLGAGVLEPNWHCRGNTSRQKLWVPKFLLKKIRSKRKGCDQPDPAGRRTDPVGGQIGPIGGWPQPRSRATCPTSGWPRLRVPGQLPGVGFYFYFYFLFKIFFFWFYFIFLVFLISSFILVALAFSLF